MSISEIILISIFRFWIFVLILCNIKSIILYRKTNKLLDLIYLYQYHQIVIRGKIKVEFEDIEKPHFFDLSIWNYKKLLPKEKFKILKDFVDTEIGEGIL